MTSLHELLNLFAVDWSLVGSGWDAFHLEAMVESGQTKDLVLGDFGRRIAFFSVVHVCLKTTLGLLLLIVQLMMRFLLSI